MSILSTKMALAVRSSKLISAATWEEMLSLDLEPIRSASPTYIHHFPLEKPLFATNSPRSPKSEKPHTDFLKKTAGSSRIFYSCLSKFDKCKHLIYFYFYLICRPARLFLFFYLCSYFAHGLFQWLLTDHCFVYHNRR